MTSEVLELRRHIIAGFRAVLQRHQETIFVGIVETANSASGPSRAECEVRGVDFEMSERSKVAEICCFSVSRPLFSALARAHV